MSDYTVVYCTLEPKLQESKFLMDRLEKEGFVVSKKNRCLFYKRMHNIRLGDPQTQVSYYYYLNNKKKEYHNYDFSARRDSISEKLEYEAKCAEYNISNGYASSLDDAKRFCRAEVNY